MIALTEADISYSSSFWDSLQNKLHRLVGIDYFDWHAGTNAAGNVRRAV